MGKLIPDSVGLAQTELAFVPPASLAVSNVEVGDVGYSGTLEYAGGNQLRITGIRRVTLPPTAAEAAAAAIAQAEADAAAAVSGAQAAAEAAMAEAEAAMADKAAAMADAEAAMAAMADAAEAGAAASQAKVDAMMAEAYQPSEVMVSAAMLDPSMANLDQVQVTLAGPDSIYVSNIMYGGVPFSALLRYRGGTSATVEAVYGPMGKLIPDSVGLAQTALAFVAPASLAVENVEVGGVGYSGTLEYAGGNQLLVTGIRRVNLPPTEAEMAQAENESLKATIADQSDQITALQAALAEAQAAADTAMADADAAMADNAAAMVDADAAMAEAAAAQAKVDAMMAAAYQPSEVMVSAAMLDPSQANIDHAQVSLAGPDSIYVSNIMYGGVPYSALLKYSGGTSATVEAVYGPMGKLIPDSVGLSQVELDFVAPASLAIENVEVGGVGYSGTLEYAGGNQLRVTGIRRVTLPPTEAEAAQAAAAAAIAQAEADAAAAIAQAEADAAAAVSEAQAAADMARSEAQAATDAAVSAAMADADAAQAEAAAAQAEVDAMMAAAYQPSEVMVSAAMLDPSQANIDHAQVSLAGPDSIYVSNIMYGGVPYSALLKYSGGTSATVEAVYGPMGKLLPDSVGLSQVELDFVAPASLAVSNVEVGGVGYSGTLEYAGGNQLRVTGIRRVTLPPTAAEAAAAAIAQAEADAAAAIAQAEADAAAAVSDAQAAADAAMADAEAAQAAADAAMADADAARAEAAAAQAKVDAMMAAAFQPSEVMISAAMLDPSLANIDHAQVSLAGPDSIYISNIMYDGVPYSALLKYSGGTSATVEAVYGPMGKLLPDSVGLSQVELDFVAPASLAVSNVDVGGVGYSGTLEYAGGNQLRVTGIRRVTLPPTAAEAAAAAITQAEADAAAAVSDAQAAADAAMADADAAQAAADAAMADADAARAEAAAAQAKVDAMMAAAFQPSEVMVSAAMLDPSQANIDHAQVSLAGPDSIYVSNIMYGGVPYSALLKYSGGTSATVEAVYGPMGKLIPDSVGLSQVELDFVAPASLAIENVEVGGVGYSGTLEYAGGNQLRVTGIRRVTLPPTEAEAAQAAAAAAIAQAEADAAAAIAQAEADAAAAVSEAQADADAAVSAAMADADAARAAASAAEAKAAAAQAEVDAMMAAAYQPSEVMVSAAMLDPSQANIDHAQVSLAGPDSIYVSNIMYGGVPYSALLKYSGGTSATVEAVYGPMGKLIPDSVGLSQVELDFVAPASLAIENVEVGGVGYSGTLEYAGGNQLQVTGIRRVTLPPTEAEAAQAAAAAAIAQAEADAAAAIAQAEADAAAAVSEAQAAADMARSEAQAATDAAVSAAMADADAARAAASAAEAKAAAAQAEVDAMMAAAYQPSEVMVSAAMLDPSQANIDHAQVSLAGPDSIYVSNIMYGGVPYSALLKYSGGTSATVEAVYGPMGKLIPDSVGLSQVELDFVAPASLAIENVEVGGVGYSGTLEYAGGNQLRVTGIRRVTLPPTEAEAAQAAAAAAIAQAEADAAAAIAQAEADAAAAVSEAQAAADMARSEAQAATDAAVSAAMADADAAQAEVDAMMAAAYQPSEVMVSAAMLDPSQANIDHAQVSLAGPDSIYVSNIMYGGVPYSALLKYSGGTSATVEAVYGPMGKLLPDSVGLSQVELDFVAPASLAIENVEVGGVGYSGTLEYAGGNQLRVTGIRRVTLPPTAAEAAAAAIAQAEADAAAAVNAAQAVAEAAMADADAAQAAADAAMADADAAMADADAARAEAVAAQAEATAAQMMAAAYQPSEVMISAAMLDPSLANIDHAQVSLAGPDSIYISNIMYDGVPYSALLKYSGGTSATVEAVYGPMGKLLPDSVGLSQVELDFVAPASLAVSNVEVGGVGYSGTLEYAGGNQLRVTGIRRVTLPPTEAEAAQAAAAAAIAQAEADAAAAIAQAEADAAVAVSDAQAAADAAMADAGAAQAAADKAMAAADAAQAAANAAEAAAAQAKVDAMMAAAYQPSEVMISAAMLNPGLASLDQVQISLAGPDAIYVSNIMYDGAPYSALLKYSGGTSATVEAVYGPMGKLLPDSVGLSQVELAFVAPASVVVSNVEVGGVGYAGTLEYAGGNQLRVTGIRQVTLPPTDAELARADADAAMADAAKARDDAAAAMADADTAKAAAMTANAKVGELEARIKELTEGIPLGINPGLLDLESARLTIAGPNSIYISGIKYAGKDVSARVRYAQGTGTAEAVFESSSNLVDVLDMNAAEVELAGDALVMSNVGIRGRAHTLTLTFNDEGGVDVAAQDDGWAVRTVGELRRDKLITEGTYVVNGFAGGQPLANEGAWSESGGSVVQTDSGASHAKFTIPASQSGSEMLFGVTASAGDGSDKVGFGLHLLASDTPVSGNTWNYGRSYLIWATRDPFYDTDATHLQFYESRDNNTLTWLASRSIDQSLSSPLTLEVLYQSNGMVTLLVGGEEQLSLNIGSAISAGDRVALRSLGGPVQFTQVYVAAR